MTTPYAESYKFEKRYKYPHMKKEDIAIWERFISKFPNAYVSCQYDVPVGEEKEELAGEHEEIGGESWKLHQKKIDVVGYAPNSIDVAELKPRAGAAAVGQVKNYKRLFIKDYTPPLEPRAVIITDEASQDFRDFAREEGVVVIVV